MLWGENYSLTSFINNHLDDLFGAIWIPIFPKICNRGFSETKTSHLSSNFRFRKVQITEITTQKKSVVSWPWSGPQKNQDLYTSHNHGNESGWNVFWEKKSVFVCSFSWPSPKFLLSFVLDGILIVHEKNWHQKTNNRNPKSWKFTSKRFSLSFPDDGNYTPKNERMTIIARKTTMNEDVSPFLLLFSIVMLVSLTVASSNRFWSAESGKYLTSHLNSSPYKGKWSKNWKIQGYSIAPYRTMVIS